MVHFAEIAASNLLSSKRVKGEKMRLEGLPVLWGTELRIMSLIVKRRLGFQKQSLKSWFFSWKSSADHSVHHFCPTWSNFAVKFYVKKFRWMNSGELLASSGEYFNLSNTFTVYHTVCFLSNKQWVSMSVDSPPCLVHSYQMAYE